MVSSSTHVVNAGLIYITAVSILLFALIVFLMMFFTVRFRSTRNPVATEIRDNPLLETVWIVVPILIVTTMFLYGLADFRFLRTVPPDALEVKVYARQWSWLFEYPNGKKSPDMVVPVGRDIDCELISHDVIHGFYIPAFRIQEDVVPGIPTRAWFNATETGSSYILCSQYCGLQHSAMIARLYAVPPETFTAWMAGKKVAIGEGSLTADMPAGERLLTERGCLSCHSLYGNKMVGPTFKGLYGSTVPVKIGNKATSVIADSAYIRESILHPGAAITAGYPSTMPPGCDVLSDKDIDEVIDYLKTLK